MAALFSQLIQLYFVLFFLFFTQKNGDQFDGIYNKIGASAPTHVLNDQFNNHFSLKRRLFDNHLGIFTIFSLQFWPPLYHGYIFFTFLRIQLHTNKQAFNHDPSLIKKKKFNKYSLLSKLQVLDSSRDLGLFSKVFCSIFHICFTWTTCVWVCPRISPVE